MMRTITHLYDTHAEAAHAVRLLEAAGVAHERIGLLGRRDVQVDTAEDGTEELVVGGAAVPSGDVGSGGIGSGATLGTVLGGGAGLLAGLGTLAIPGVGPVVAAGWLVSTLTGAGAGAAAGGLLGAVVGSGMPDHDADFYAEGMRRGGTIVSVQADDADAERVEGVLASTGRVPVGQAEKNDRIEDEEAALDHRVTAPAVTTPERRPGAGYPTDADRAAEATEVAVERERERLPYV